MIHVKICGITRPEDGISAREEGADFMGLVFAPSPRQVDRGQAENIVRQIPDFKGWVGVFVNEIKETVVQIALSLGIRYLQLHGDESTTECAYFEQRGFQVIKAQRIQNTGSFNNLARYATPFTLLDRYSATREGGTGEAFDWRLLANRKFRSKVFISGGLRSNNLKNVLRYFSPFAFDVSSGVESRLGIKSRAKIRAFVKACHKLGGESKAEFQSA